MQCIAPPAEHHHYLVGHIGLIAKSVHPQVAESGLDFVIVRTAKSDGDASLTECGVTVTPQGSLTSSSKVTKAQV